MRWTLRLGIGIVLAAALAGAAAGYLTAARYRPPADDGEGRLRERAAQFYRASQVMDFWSMVRLYTPAWQQADGASLRQQADEKQRIYGTFKDETRADMVRTADSISAADIEVERDGDWAVTRGETILYQGDLEIPFPLNELVWIRTGGDWWVYQRKNPELLAYGNPPDFALKLLKLQSEAGDDPSAIEIPTAPPEEPGAADEEPAEQPDE